MASKLVKNATAPTAAATAAMTLTTAAWKRRSHASAAWTLGSSLLGGAGDCGSALMTGLLSVGALLGLAACREVAVERGVVALGEARAEAGGRGRVGVEPGTGTRGEEGVDGVQVVAEPGRHRRCPVGLPLGGVAGGTVGPLALSLRGGGLAVEVTNRRAEQAGGALRAEEHVVLAVVQHHHALELGPPAALAGVALGGRADQPVAGGRPLRSGGGDGLSAHGPPPCSALASWSAVGRGGRRGSPGSPRGGTRAGSGSRASGARARNGRPALATSPTTSSVPGGHAPARRRAGAPPGRQGWSGSAPAQRSQPASLPGPGSARSAWRAARSASLGSASAAARGSSGSSERSSGLASRTARCRWTRSR